MALAMPALLQNNVLDCRCWPPRAAAAGDPHLDRAQPPLPKSDGPRRLGRLAPNEYETINMAADAA